MPTENENSNIPTAPETPVQTAAETAQPSAPEQTTAPEVTAAPPAPENLLKRLVRAIDRAIAADPKRTGWELQCFMLLQSCGGHRCICNSADYAKLVDWQKQHDRINEWINSRTHNDAVADFEAHQGKMATAIHKGSVEDETGATLQHFQDSLQMKLDASKRDLQRIYLECQPMCEDFAGRFVALAEQRVNGMEKEERSKHDYFGIPYAGPSNLILTFRKAIHVAKCRVVPSEFGNASPRQMLPYFPL
jgi:hypothetical protein